MVLINGYTISKSDVDEVTPGSLVESPQELEDARELRPRPRPRPCRGRLGRRGRDQPLALPTTHPHKTTTAASQPSRLGTIWAKLRHRNRTMIRSKYSNRFDTQIGYNDNYIQNKYNDHVEINKREITTEFNTKDIENIFGKNFFKNTKDFFANTRNNQMKFFNWTSLEPLSSYDNYSSTLSSLKPVQSQTTTKSLSKSQTAIEHKKYSTKMTSLKTTPRTTTLEWIGTAQLEALLDNIKARALQILIDQSPTVTNLITNSVNEITFEADPILHHVEQTTSHTKSATILKSSHNKRSIESTLDVDNSDDTILGRSRRTPTEDIYTMAASVEDVLQNELKKIFKNLKGKVSKYHRKCKPTAQPKAQFKVTPTLKKSPSKTTYRTTPMTKTLMKTVAPKLQETIQLPCIKNHKAHRRVAKATRKFGKKKVKSTSTTLAPNILSSIDDAKLLGLLEQMLVKTNEYNVMHLLTTPCYTPKLKIETLSKRNIETLADLKLKEQVQGYEDSELMPSDVDYAGDKAQDAATTISSSSLGTETAEAISFESISDKISYNDYVNGYKYYLKYQQEQEQDDEKFSPMIRYQAHKHHKVDDIGKFILRKLPPVRFARNIFEEIDMDDQDISTKSEESWFRKHFYLFLDSNTPRKFHTSETVALKAAPTQSSVESRLRLPSGHSMHLTLSEPHESELPPEATVVNLDQLAKNLETYKAELSTTTIFPLVKKLMAESKDMNSQEPAEGGFIIKMMSMLLGGKDRRALNKDRFGAKEAGHWPEPRLRRHAKKSKHKENLKKSTTPTAPTSDKPAPITEHKDKFGKIGVVQMIAQPTTVVKIAGKKKSRFKNLMKKLHLTKKEKVNKKTKRQIRKRRFIPLKKLKEMLLGPQHEYHGTVKHKGVNDFDIMTSEIDTFKAIKFSRVPNIEDMRKEIPVINEDLAAPEQDREYTTKSVAAIRPTTESNNANVPVNVEYPPDKSPASNLTDQMKQMTMMQLEHYLHDYKNSIKGGSTEQLVNSTTKTPNALEKNIMEARKNLKFDDPFVMEREDLEPSKKIKEEKGVKEDKTEVPDEVNEDDLSEVKVDSLSSTEESMDVIREEVDKIQTKLNMYDTKEVAPKPNIPIADEVQTFTRIMFVPGRIQKIELKTVSTEKDKKSKIAKAAAHRTLEPKLEEIDVESVMESPQIYEYSKDAHYVPLSFPFMPIRRDSSYSAQKSNRLKNVHQNNSRESLSQYSVSPDHFRELLLWHSDILNVDLLTTTSYVPWVERDLGLVEYTTPNAELLANEVQDIKRFIGHIQPKVDKLKKNQKVTQVHKPTKTCSTTPERQVLIPGNTIGIDRFSVGANEMVVLGQAQYFAFSKDENLNLGSESHKLHALKKEKHKVTPNSVILYSKKVVSRTNWTHLVPPPSVHFNASPRSREAVGLGGKRMRGAYARRSPTTKPLTPTSKMNRAPQQYFSTPLPMDSQDFENFLKKSHLDVDTVTAPIADTDANCFTEKLRAAATSSEGKEVLNKKVTTPVNPLNSDKEGLMDALNQLQLNAKNLSQVADFSEFQFSDDARFRRHSTNAEKITSVPRQERRMKKKPKISGKKITLTQMDVPEYNVIEKENIKNYYYDAKYTSESIPEETVTLEMGKHNNLLYFYIPAKSHSSAISTSMAPTTDAEMVTMEPPEELDAGMHEKLIRHLGIKPKSNPKRVRISYHYDIVYENRSKKAKTREPVHKEGHEKDSGHASDAGRVTKLTGSERMSAHGPDYFYKPPGTKSQLSKDALKRFKRKSKRNANISSTEDPVLSKRNAVPETYTAQNVAAFEIYLDVSKSTAMTNVGPEMNALQVHIALPHEQNSNLKRQLNPIKPVFSAKMSDAVNLEYQVPLLEEKVTYSTETNSFLSPGLYMLVDNLCKSGHVTLKPILSDLSMLRPRQADSEKITESTTPKCATNNLDELKKVTLNKDFVAAVNKHLVQLYENFTSLNNNKNVKKTCETGDKNKNDIKRRRRAIWPTLKEMLGGDRVCSCHFKENQTLCPACVATDAVVGELIFEFNNLANFMKDHCTEIQTFFWMNPNGGKKLTDSVHRLDRMLHDYYKRVKGKCQGKTCQALASCLDKRTVRNRRRILKEVSLLPEDVQAIANDIAKALRHRLPYSENLKDTGEDFLNIVENCLPGVRYKKSLSNMKDNLADLHRLKDKNNRRSHQKSLNLGIKSSNYKREVTQLERPLVSDSGGAFWYDYMHKLSTEPPSVERDQRLMTETTLNALSHNINELFMLFNNMNLTGDPLSKATEEVTKSNDKKKGKEKKKKKLKKKKPKKIHKFHRKLKEKKPKHKASTTHVTPVNIDTLLSFPTQKSATTRALKVILSNVKDKPSLYVKVDKIVAISNSTTAKQGASRTSSSSRNPNKEAHLVEKVMVSDTPAILRNEETIIFEERNGIFNKLKNLFNFHNGTYTPSHNYVYNIRSARATKDELNDITEMKSLAVSTTPALKSMSVITSPPVELNLVTESTHSSDKPILCTNDSIYDTDQFVKYLIDKSTSKTDETKYYTPPKTEQNYLSPEIKDILDESSTITSENPQMSDDTTTRENEDVISELTQTPYPTIIIIDDSSTETDPDDVTIDVMPSYEEKWTSKPKTDTKDLLLSVLSFERKNIEDELQRVRESRRVYLDNTVTKECDNGLLDSKSQSTPKHPSSFASGNYSVISDLLHAGKALRKGHRGKETTTKTTTMYISDEFGLLGKGRSWVNYTDKVLESDATSQKIPHTTPSTTKATLTSSTAQPASTAPHLTTTTAALAASSSKTKHTKASDARPASRVCDLSATVRRVRATQRVQRREAFERYVRKLACYSLRDMPQYFVVEDRNMLNSNLTNPERQERNKSRLRWDGTRNQREAKKSLPDLTAPDIDEKEVNKDHREFDREFKNDGLAMDDALVNFVIDDDFEKFYKGEHGIYRMESKRRRRKAEAVNLTRELTDLPALQSTPNEILVIFGDPVTLHCICKDRAVHARWSAEPAALLRRPNVKVDGDTVYVEAARETNAGTYICQEGDREHKRVVVTVLALPRFHVVAVPLYSIQGDSCGYGDLKAIRSLSSAMSQLVCPDSDCSVSVHGPDCLRDRSDGSMLLRATLSLSVPPPAVHCSPSCRRDLLTQLVKMAVQDVPKLITANVLIAGNRNKTLVPCTAGDGSCDVTRRLRRKGAGHNHHRLQPLSPGRVELRLGCPRRYQLLPAYKICVADGPSSRSPAARREQPARRPRRYDQWWWYPSCGYVSACVGAACACSACAACALLAHQLSTPDEHRRSCWAEAARRPASPSRVLLARLFRRSLSAFRHTDSQETRPSPRKPVPPPLPPVDFD